MADDAAGVSSSFQSVVKLLDNPNPDLKLFLAQCGLAVRRAASLYGKHPVVASDLDDLGQAIGNMKHRFAATQGQPPETEI